MYSKPASPLSIGGVLDSGFSLYRSSLPETFVLAAVVALLYAPLGRLGQSVAETEPNVSPALAFTLLGVALLAIAGTVLFYGAVLAKVRSIQHGRAVTSAAALHLAGQRFFVLLGVIVLFMLAIVIGFIALVIPAVILAVALSFSFVPAVTESKGVIESLKHSFELVWGRWWRTALLLTVIAIVVGVLSFLIQFFVGIFVALQQGSIETMPWYVDFVVSPLINGLIMPLNVALVLAVYEDLKLRHEGADIAERIAAVEA